MGATTATISTFIEALLAPEPCLCLCVIVREGSPYLRFVHSAMIYFNLSAAQGYKNKVITFIKDKTKCSPPVPVIPPPQNA